MFSLIPTDEDIGSSDQYPTVNINVKSLIKMLANQNQQHIKRIIHRDQVNLFKDARMVHHIQANQCDTTIVAEERKNHVKKQKEAFNKTTSVDKI